MNSEFFPKRPEAKPTIYAYELPGVSTHEGLLKVGYTTRTSLDRIREQTGTVNVDTRIVFDEPSVREDGSVFTDHEVHQYLKARGIKNTDKEWFRCNVEDVRAAVLAVRNRELNVENRDLEFDMRPEQADAVQKTSAYFSKELKEHSEKAPHFLWNAKMRFGKTFTSYQLARKMGWKKILVLTFKPAVENAWEEDLVRHKDFEGWQFVSRKTADGMSVIDGNKPVVCFGSFQDYLGKNSAGGIKAKNKWVHETDWDCVIFDEYHFGAWREGAKSLFGADEREEGEVEAEYKGDGEEYFSEDEMPINTRAYLYLSGTPFKAIASGEFIEDQIFNWTYGDEQREKENWKESDGPNPYASLPRMVMMTYKLPDEIAEVATGGQFDEFDLNTFFSAEGEGDEAKFIYEDEVQKWLDLIRGAGQMTTIENLKLNKQKPPLPFLEGKLLNLMNHTFWFLPRVSSCYAMRNLLAKRVNVFYHDYEVIVAAGKSTAGGALALEPVLDAMDNPLESKTITLSCGKLTTGVSVKPWTGIFMLRSTSSPETYFQAAFRVQTPWEIKNPDSKSPNKTEIIKQECYVFDFALNRALRQIVDYSDGLSVGDTRPEKQIEEFIHFLPVLAYDGSSMKQIDAAGVLDIAMSGTTATLLARRWESALLVNVDNTTLQRLMDSEDAMNALMSIEGFRSLNQDIETIINKTDKVKKAKAEANERELTKKEKQELSDDEKEYKNTRKKIQEKLIKFATRIPVFMYLTDYREETLKDVITQLEPGLFRKVTGLTIRDFELLVSLGVFNDALMNDAVYKFRRYEDPSLEYAGINTHTGEKIGLFSTVIDKDDYSNHVSEPGVIYNESQERAY
jgi:hypothetical protein